MNGKRAKIIRKTSELLFMNKQYMSKFPDWFTERMLYKMMKSNYTKGSVCQDNRR